MSVLLIPNGEQLFLDANGNPVQFGTVGMYIPGTLTPKDTWQDPDQTALNVNPIPLNGSGRAVIWGAGYYRQILKDQLGNTIWDKQVAAATGQDVYWGGLSGGAPNLQTLTAPGFTFEDGAMINWVAGFTNTGPLFVDVNGSGGVQVLSNSASGAVPLIGGEIVAGNIVTMVASVDAGAFLIVSGVSSTRNLNVVGTFSRSGILAVNLVANTDDWDPPGIEESSILLITPSSDLLQLTGINAPLVNGTFYLLDNVHATRSIILKAFGTSAPGNQFLLPADYVIPPRSSVEIHYDSSGPGWRVIDALILPNIQTFDASGTWTKPAGNYRYAKIECWGGGGSGGRRTGAGHAGGGGGGSYTSVELLVSSLGATEPVTVGLGGAAVTVGDADGNSGGNSSFGTWLTAYFGSGGDNQAINIDCFGGGGGGLAGPGVTGAQGGGLVGGGGGSASAIAANAGCEGGGGGGGGVDLNNTDISAGGAAFKGGGGGGAANNAGTVTAGGISVFGGDGGIGAVSANAVAGQAPGGGGGGARGGNSGAGGNGRVVVTLYN